MKGQVTLSSTLNGKVVGKPVVVNKGETTSSSPGAAPEPPRALPKNELKEIDKDSTAANNPKKGDGPGSKEGPGDGKERKPASEGLGGPTGSGADFEPKERPPVLDGPANSGSGCPPKCGPQLPPPPRHIPGLVVPKTKLIIKPQ